MNKKLWDKLIPKQDDPIIAKAFLATLIAMVVSELASSLATMTDGIILARYLGEYAIASHGLTTTCTNIIKVLILFFSTGTEVSCSEALAKMDLKRSNQYFTMSSIVLGIISVLMGLAFFVFSEPIALWLGASEDPEHLLMMTSDYIKGLGIALPFMLATSFLTPIMALNGDKKRIALSINVMMIVNIAGDLLNALVIKGGMLGMALATAAGYVCSFTILILHFFNTQGITFSFSDIKIKRFGRVVKNGILPAIMRIFSTIRSYYMNLILVSMSGTAVLAANSLTQSSIRMVFICISMGIGSASLIIASVLYTEKDKRGLHQLFKSVITVCVDPCIVLAILIGIFAPFVASLFGAGQYINLTALALREYMVAFPIISLKMFYIYYFQALGYKKLSFYSSFAGEFFYLVGFAYILAKFAGPTSVFLAYPLSEYTYIISLLVILIFRNKRFPRSLDEFLFLDKNFAKEDRVLFDANIKSKDEVLGLSENARKFCIEHNVPDKNSMLLALAIEEMGANIFEHGMSDGKNHFVELKIVIEGDDLIVRFRDDCPAFNPKEKADMLSDDDLIHNVGIRMIMNMAKDVQYANIFSLNELVITI